MHKLSYKRFEHIHGVFNKDGDFYLPFVVKERNTPVGYGFADEAGNHLFVCPVGEMDIITNGIWTTCSHDDTSIELIIVGNKSSPFFRNAKCPFCGTMPEIATNLRDVVYPTDQTREMYQFVCSDYDCGYRVLGGSPIEVIERWMERQI